MLCSPTLSLSDLRSSDACNDEHRQLQHVEPLFMWDPKLAIQLLSPLEDHFKAICRLHALPAWPLPAQLVQDRAAAVGQSAFGVQDVQRVVADIVPTHPWQPKYWVRPQSLLEGPHVQLRREPHARICGAAAEEASSAFIPWGARSYLSLFFFFDAHPSL